MKNGKIITIILTLIFFVSPVFGEEELLVRLPSKENFHLFLLAGQSNMAGRGKVTEEDKKIHPRVFALSKDGKWKPAVDPIHYDKKVAGVGLGKSFAIALAEHTKNISIGLVPAACGGSSISVWEPGKYYDKTKSHPYDDALKRIQHARKDGVLKGILWHQGESDSRHPQSAKEYMGKLKALIERFRKDLNAPSVPFIIGQLGQFPENPWSDSKKLVNDAHISIAKGMTSVSFVPSDSLTCKKDNVHFDAKSLREFGGRYAKAYLKMAESGPRD